MISKDTEYSMLKQEIISTTDIISNITLAMYTITVSIIVLAFETENAVIFLAPYIVLYPFQNIINRKRDGINRIAAYIAVFLEKEKGWEGQYNQYYEVMRGYNKGLMLTRKVWNFIIGRTNSTQLGLLSTVLFNYFYFKTVQIADIGIKDAALVATSILLFVVLAFENKIIISNKDIRTMYIEQLKLLKSLRKNKFATSQPQSRS